MTKTSYRIDRYNFRIHQALPIPTLKDNVILGTTYPTSRTSRKKSNLAKIHAKNHISGSTH